MAGQRHYDDPCGIARALDLLGERWALLVVRELIFGGKRFGQLRKSLPGAGPNVISQRLAQLAAAGIVTQRRLEPPAEVTVYELTERGRAIEPILWELGRWGSRTPMASGAEMSTAALLLALKTTYTGDGDGVYEVAIDGERFTVRAGAGTLDVTAGRADKPVASFASDVATLRRFAFGRMSLTTAEASGRLTVTGSRRAATRFPALFAVPTGG